MRAIALILTLLVIAVLLLASDQTRKTIEAIDPIILLWIVLLQTLYLLPQAYRYWIILDHASSQELPFWPWAQIFVVGRFLNLAVSQAGNLYRAVVLKRDHGIAYAEYVTSFFAFAWLATLLNFGLAIAVLAIAREDHTIGGISILAGLVVGGAALAAGPIAISRLISATNSSTRWGRLKARSSQLLDSSVAMLKQPRLIGRFVAVGLVGFAMAATIYFATFRAVAVDVSLPEVVLFYVLIQLTTYLVITPGNLGIQELSMAGLAEATGIGSIPGLLAGAAVRLTSVAALIIVGLFLGGGRSLAEVRSPSDGSPE